MSVLLLIVFSLQLAFGAYCNGKPNPNAPMNMNPILTGKPVHIKSVKHGHLYQVNDGVNMFPIVHLYGTPEQMGFAQGLLRPDAADFIHSVYKYLDDAAYEAVNGSGHYPPWMPQWLFDDLVNLGVNAALQAELEATKNFTGEHFFEELRGLSFGTGLTQQKLEWVHLIGELTKGSCSTMGAWGAAVPDRYSLVMLRALDWDMDGPFRDYPQITIYHPPRGHAFANVGYAGFIGSFSGMSSVPMATAEIGVSYPDDTFGEESRFGNPFTYLLRDILQFDKSLDDAINHISTTNRTCNLILGVGDGNLGHNVSGYRGVEYSHSVANFFDDTNMMPEADWHPRIPNTVYYGMDWNCPNYDTVFAQQINATYGKITPEVGIQNISAIIQSGDNFASWYDLTPTTQQLFTAFASAHGAPGPANAFERAYTRLDMLELWKVAPPTTQDIESTKDVKWDNKAIRQGQNYFKYPSTGQTATV